jgi:hypothetical protein
MPLAWVAMIEMVTAYHGVDLFARKNPCMSFWRRVFQKP